MQAYSYSPINSALLVDDSEIDLFIVERLLNVLNFSKKLTTYKSAQAAIDHLSHSDHPDIIFLDLSMPGIDGFMFLKMQEALRKPNEPKPRIVVLTSSNNVFDKERVLKHSDVVHFITKPLTEQHVEELKKMVATGH